jgi:hypothetical protein
MMNRFSGKLRRMAAAMGFAVLASLSWSASALDLLTGDFHTILNSRNNGLVVWQYADNPNIYVFDFPNLTQQGRTFNRITHLTEQFNEPYKRVLSIDEILKYMEAVRRTQADFAFGHDVLVSELVLFFNLAERDKLELFEEEIVLREFVIQQGLMKVWRGIYQALKPDVVILSIPQTQEKKENEPRVSELARRAIFTHEISHGEYYANPYYSRYCQRFWFEVLNDEQRELFKNFLSKYNYAVNGEELLINEMQAYLLFTPDPNSFSAKKLGIKDEELEAMRNAFRKGKPPTKLPLY